MKTYRFKGFSLSVFGPGRKSGSKGRKSTGVSSRTSRRKSSMKQSSGSIFRRKPWEV
ncbi:MAG: hypothetical protein SD837_21950 [Candidatus Electrothrix scaldis]|nr:MAG: hypothetical protein SD837_21950 [Candidatus Electrothrix sp. GW3-3]